jgi:hypothetical protein
VFVYAATGPASVRPLRRPASVQQASVRQAGGGNVGDEGDGGDREEGEEQSDLTFADVCAWRDAQDFFPGRV